MIEGLRRLEYRGYDSAGIALVDDGLDRLGQARGQARQPREGHRRDAAPGVHDRHRSHPVGDPRRAQRRQRAPAPGPDRTGRAGAQRHHRELRPSCAPSSRRQGTSWSPRPTPRSPPTCSSASSPGRPHHRDAARLPAARGRVHPGGGRRGGPPAVVAARRNSPLVVGVGEGENFLGSDVAAFIEHTREALELGQDQVVTITREGVAVTGFDGTPAEGRRYHVDWDLSAAEKDGYDWFMRKEIFEQPQAVADSLLGRVRRRAAAARRDAALRRGPARRRQDHHHRVRHRRSTPAWSRSTPSSTGPGSRSRSSWPPSSATATRSSTHSTLVVAISQSGETADTLQAIRHAREQRSKVLAICNTNGSTIPRESDAVLYTHAGPEIGVASTKGFLTQLVACYLLGALPRPGQGHAVRRRDREVHRPAAGDAGAHPDRARRAPTRSTTWPASTSTPRRCCSSAGTPATRWPSRAR